jgi:hypothetical protein
MTRHRNGQMRNRKTRSVDDVLSLPIEGLDPGDIEEAMKKMFERADLLVEKYNLQPPITARLLDGHGNQIFALEIEWDENGNSKSRQVGEFNPNSEAPGMFLVLRDSRQKSATVQLTIGTPQPN